MWYWGAHGMQHAGKVIIVGGDAATVRRLGFTPASTMDDALEIATDVVGRSPTITHLHDAAAADRGRDVMATVAHRCAGAPRAAGAAERRTGVRTTPLRNVGLPVPRRRPCRAASRCRPRSRTLGADYDTEWARTPLARAAAVVLIDGPLRLRGARPSPIPRSSGIDRLADLRPRRGRRAAAAGDLRPQPPQPRRHAADAHVGARAVARTTSSSRAAADYFFDKRWKARARRRWRSNAIPIDREPTGPPVGRPDRRPDRRRLEPA